MVAISIRGLGRICVQTAWKLVQLFLFLIIVPPLINYASLKREAPLLAQHGNESGRWTSFCLYRVRLGLPYDVGYGQKLFLRCRGHGAPTGLSPMNGKIRALLEGSILFPFSYL